MLVLSRKRNERVVISKGELEITIVVVEIRDDKTRLGFDAPADFQIHREEVHDAIKRNSKRAEKEAAKAVRGGE